MLNKFWFCLFLPRPQTTHTHAHTLTNMCAYPHPQTPKRTGENSLVWTKDYFLFWSGLDISFCLTKCELCLSFLLHQYYIKRLFSLGLSYYIAQSAF